TAGEAGYKYGLAMGAVGALAFLAAVVRSLIISRGASTSYFAQSGALLLGLGVLWMAVSAGLCSDNRLVVMTRRELAGFFYSPIAYIVFFCMTVVGWLLYWLFIGQLWEVSQPSMQGGGQGLIEPIVQYYIFHLVPV